MELTDNKYFSDIMMKYFLILIEIGIYQHRQNSVYIRNYPDDRIHGIYEAMKEIALEDNCVICYNFDPNFPVEAIDNLHFISNSTLYHSVVPCDFLFIFRTVEYMKVKYLCDYYNPKFVFHC